MRILLWHVHGSWTTAFVSGRHEYLVPVLARPRPRRPRPRADLGLAGRRSTELHARASWPTTDIDVVVLQRPHELHDLCERWTGRRPGRDLPAIYVEHNAPQGRIADMRHPAADRDDLLVCHVTHFNELFWDCGTTPTRVIEHGIVDPGPPLHRRARARRASSSTRRAGAAA